MRRYRWLLCPVVVLAFAAPIAAAQNGNECFAACIAERWLANHSEEDIAKAQPCRGELDEALANEEAALAIRAAGYRTYQDQIDQFNALITQRGDALALFRECIQEVWRPVPVEEEFASSDEIPPPAEAPPPSSLPPFELHADKEGGEDAPPGGDSTTGGGATTSVHAELLKPTQAPPKQTSPNAAGTKPKPPKAAPPNDTRVELQTSAKILPPKASPPPTNPLVAIDQALAPWGPQLQALSDFLGSISDYDIAGRPDAGIKVIEEIFLGMALDHLVKHVPAALKALKAADDAAEGTAKSGALQGRITQTVNETGESAAETWRSQLPPRAELPPDLLAKPRNVFFQEASHSCAIACSRMVTETQLGTAPTQQWFLKAAEQWRMYKPGTGTYASDVTGLLSAAGVSSREVTGATLDDIARATATGNPAIVGGRGHAVVVDTVLDTPQGRYVVYRDPWSLDQVTDATSRRFLEAAGFHNHSAIPAADFARNVLNKDGLTSAVFTNP